MAYLISGTIAAGKTTLGNLLSQRLGTKLWAEPLTGNPFLEKFYDDPVDYSFKSQMFFLNERFNCFIGAKTDDILDRSIDENMIFGQTLFNEEKMTKEEWDLYQDVYKNMRLSLKDSPNHQNDLIVFLKIDLDTMLKQLMTRGRSYEKVNTEMVDYYEHLIEGYNDWYKRYDGLKMVIDKSKYDFSNPEDVNEVLDQIIDVKTNGIHY